MRIMAIYANPADTIRSGVATIARHGDDGGEVTALVPAESGRVVGRVPFPPGPGEAAISIRQLGSHGHVTRDDYRPEVVRYGADGPTPRPTPGATSGHPIIAFLEHVVGSLLAGITPDYTGRDAVEAIRVIDAAYRSVASGDVVALDR